MLEKLNRFTRRNLTEDEVYIFDVILCDNEIDRDFEIFSDNSLEKLKSLFIGKTGIFDHNPKGANQTARIFDTEVVSDSSKLTSYGKPYKCLKAMAYMVRTDSNADLIKEIDAGIKKELSISCSAEKQLCSVCGCDRKIKSCVHIKGKKYGDKICYTILDGITDAYEWSFVAIPAQINAGITSKHFNNEKSYDEISAELKNKDSIINLLYDELKRDVIKLCYFNSSCSEALLKAVDKMDISELADFKHSLIKENKSRVSPQLKHSTKDSFSDFKIEVKK